MIALTDAALNHFTDELFKMLGLLIGGVVTVLLARITRQQNNAASHVRDVKEALAANDTAMRGKLDYIQDTTTGTRRLVNGAMSANLRIAAVALRRIAHMTGEEEDDRGARLAEKALLDHEADLEAADRHVEGLSRSDAPQPVVVVNPAPIPVTMPDTPSPESRPDP